MTFNRNPKRRALLPSPLPARSAALKLVSPVLAAGLLLGCSDQEPSATSTCEVIGCSHECASLHVQACDIRERACQDSVRKSVECVRGLKFDARPEVEITSGAQFDAGQTPSVMRRTVEAGFRDVPLHIEGELPTSAQITGYHWTTALQELDLLATEQTAEGALKNAASRYAGRYTPMKQVLEVVLDSNADQWAEMGTLAHEMIHALQDQERDLDAWRSQLAEDGVSNQAIRSFVEGEAQFYGLLTLGFMLRVPAEKLDIDEWLAAWRKAFLHSLLGPSAAITSLQQLPYFAGAELHLARWHQHGTRGTEELARNMPRSMIGWMQQDASVEPDFDCSQVNDESPQGWSLVGRGSMGPEFVLPLLLRDSDDQGAELATAWHAASHLRGDCLKLYGESANHFALHDAGAPPSYPGASDAGASDADADTQSAFTAPTARLADVRAEWTMKFSDVEPKFLRKLDAPHHSYKQTSQVSFSSTDDLLNVSLSTTGKLDYDSPLVDCWPLYPFDPNEVYLSEDVWFPSDDDATWREISHWSEPDVSLGGLPPDAYDAQVMASGDLIYGGKQLTPDWCNHRGEREPLPLPSPLGNDPGVPGPCDAQANPALETRVGLTGEILFRCEAKPDSWQADNGKVVVSTDLGELLSVGAQNTLMLSTGLLRRDADADGVASCADADAAATVTTSQFGVLLPLANLTRTQIIATRARPDGYWVAVNGETAAELWHVDFSGCSEQLGVYPEEPKVFDRFIAQLDGYGRLFELEPYGLSGLSVRSLDGSSSSRDVSADRFITGP